MRVKGVDSRYMRALGKFFFLILVVSLMACEDAAVEDNLSIFSYTFNFRESEYGWKYGFADYPAVKDDTAVFELKYNYSNKLDGENAVMLSGKSPDDLFMYLKKQITDLAPETEYILTFNVEVASGATNNLTGATGGNISLKAGAVAIEPQSVVQEGNVVMNINKGTASSDGVDMVSLGDVNTYSANLNYSFVTKSNSVSNYQPVIARTNSNGELWLIVGTDSEFDGTTTVFYKKISVVLSVSDKH